MSDKKAYLNIPGEKSRELLARRQQFVARGVSSTMSVFAAKAEGAIIEDVDGNRYIDFAGGIGVMNIGHSRPEVVKAIAEQAAKFTHTCFSVMMYEPYIDLAERIVKIAPGAFPKKALFFNSGAEAVENAVMIARYATGKPAIITVDNAFHGRTLMTMTMTAKVKPYKHRFGPYAPEVYHAPFPYPYRMNMTAQEASDFCIRELERMFVGEVAPDQVAAIVIEPVQGEGGFMPAPAGFLHVQERFSLVGDVRGLGGMAAMELVSDRTSKEPDSHAASDVLAAAHHRGLVLIKAGMYDNVLRILVPLSVTDEQLKQGLDIFEEALSSVAEAEAITSVG